MAGPDRPGLVNSLSTAISEAEGNWEGSRMARFAGHFAGVVHVVVSRAHLEQLKNNLNALAGDGMLVSVIEDDVSPLPSPSGTDVLALEVVGQDRSGIVSQITRGLADMGVNVNELITECHSAPMSGERLFEVNAVIETPPSLSEQALQDQIEAIAGDLFVTISRVDV